MTALKYWDGRQWVKSYAMAAPVGAPGQPRVGELLAVQRQYGRGTGYGNLINGAVIWCDTAGTQVMRLSYTPLVPCWWDVSALIGNIRKGDAAYHYRYTYLKLTPADADNQSISYQYEMQHTDVQYYAFSQFQRCWKLLAGVAYVCEVIWSASGGSWFVSTSSTSLNMQGRVYSR